MSEASDTLPLSEALGLLGRNGEAREAAVAACRAYEARADWREFDVREAVTGPIVDALHGAVGVLETRLQNGLVFNFHYRSKIARDLVLAGSGLDHVFEPQTTKLLLHLARRGGHALVAGAYFGDLALQIARALGPGGTVHAFEPNPDQLAMLEHNAARNGLSNLLYNREALWDEPVAGLRMVGDDALARVEASVADSYSVPAVTIETYSAAAGVAKWSLFQMDIEGSEYRALRGARAFLQEPAESAPDIVFEIHALYTDWKNGLNDTPILRLLRECGYETFCVRDYQSAVPMPGLPIELIPPERAYLEGPPHGFNMVAVKDVERLRGPNFRMRYDVSPKLLRHRDPARHQPLSDV